MQALLDELRQKLANDEWVVLLGTDIGPHVAEFQPTREGFNLIAQQIAEGLNCLVSVETFIDPEGMHEIECLLVVASSQEQYEEARHEIMQRLAADMSDDDDDGDDDYEEPNEKDITEELYADIRKSFETTPTLSIRMNLDEVTVIAIAREIAARGIHVAPAKLTATVVGQEVTWIMLAAGRTADDLQGLVAELREGVEKKKFDEEGELPPVTFSLLPMAVN